MEEWPLWKLNRIARLVESQALPTHGEALDFGCGNGVFTEVLRTALPGWHVHGADISRAAVERATELFPRCTFHHIDSPDLQAKRFDFVFSHHVLEHVEDIDGTVARLANWISTRGSVMHILPCGNSDSFEHRLCLFRQNGIDASGRFFFEDSKHLRRLTTAELVSLHECHRLSLRQEFYANQYAGAVNWVTGSRPRLVLKITNPAEARTREAKRELRRLRRRLLTLGVVRIPAQRIQLIGRRRQRYLKHYLFCVVAAPFWPFSAPVDRWLVQKAEREWESRRMDRGGSEMYVTFEKQA